MEATESETSSLEAFDRTVLDTRKENRGGNAGKLLDSPSTMENTTGPEGTQSNMGLPRLQIVSLTMPNGNGKIML